VNFAISAQAKKSGLDHLGIQAEDGAELENLRVRLAQADVSTSEQKGVSCCYARSDKYWTSIRRALHGNPSTRSIPCRSTGRTNALNL